MNKVDEEQNPSGQAVRSPITALKSCPFCGGHAHIEQIGNPDAYSPAGYFAAVCVVCDALINYRCNDAQEAADRWNARPDVRDEGCLCQRCGRRYRVDLRLPDELWARIQYPDWPNLLCGICIMERIEQWREFDYYDLIHGSVSDNETARQAGSDQPKTQE